MSELALPAQMSAVVLHSYEGDMSGVAVESRPVSHPGPGEVLIRVGAAPINPSDLSFLRGRYVRKKLPVVAGFEGAGTVVAVGEGVNPAQWLVGMSIVSPVTVTAPGPITSLSKPPIVHHWAIRSALNKALC